MNKALCIADLHLHTAPLWRFDWLSGLMDSAAEQYGSEMPLFLLGDVFEVRNHVDARVINSFLRLLNNWEERIVWVTGQHDTYRPGRATLEDLDIARLTIVDRDVFEDVEGNWFVPFCRQDSQYRELLAKVPDNANVFTHLPVSDALEHFGKTEGVHSSEFDRFKVVVSGDIHTFSTFGKVHYVGAPSQRDWRDKSVKGKIGLWDGESLERLSTHPPLHLDVVDVESTLKVLKDNKCVLRGEESLIEELKHNENVIDTVIAGTKSFAIVDEDRKIRTDAEIISNHVSKINPVEYRERLQAAGLKFINERLG